MAEDLKLQNMYNYDFDKLNQLFSSLIEQHLDDSTIAWLKEKLESAQEGNSFSKLTVAFSMVARKVKNQPLTIAEEHVREIEAIIPHLSVSQWTLRRLVRVWLVLQIDATDQKLYTQQVQHLFSDADMNELATLYAALPVLPYPEYWADQCAEGIRSNIGYVLDAVIIDNPYPANYLKEEAWNQLVLKAFFTEKEITKIVGLKERVNEKLIKALQDYADERNSAKREVNPQLWEIVNLMPQQNR